MDKYIEALLDAASIVDYTVVYAAGYWGYVERPKMLVEGFEVQR